MGCKTRVGEGQRWSGLDVILYISTVKYLHKVTFKWECIQRFLSVETDNSLRYSKVVSWYSRKTENAGVFLLSG